jgi:hypothetical protein
MKKIVFCDKKKHLHQPQSSLLVGYLITYLYVKNNDLELMAYKVIAIFGMPKKVVSQTKVYQRFSSGIVVAGFG